MVLIGVWLLYNAVLVSAVQQCELAISIHLAPSSWALRPPAFSIPPLQVITEHWAELPVLHSSFPPVSVSHVVVLS